MQCVTGLLGVHGSRCGIGIEIVDKEERLYRLGSSLCSGTIYRRIGGTIGPVAGMNRL